MVFKTRKHFWWLDIAFNVPKLENSVCPTDHGCKVRGQAKQRRFLMWVSVTLHLGSKWENTHDIRRLFFLLQLRVIFHPEFFMSFVSDNPFS